MKKLGLFILLLFFCALTGCGFHLRGEIPLAPALHNLYIKTRTPYSDLTQNLTQYLKMSHVNLAETAQGATTVLQILSENSGQTLLGVNSTLQTRQYNLTLTVTFIVTDPNGTALIPQQTATETRTLTISSSQVLGGSNEATALTQAMRQAIVFDIMNILSSHSITTQLNTVKMHP